MSYTIYPIIKPGFIIAIFMAGAANAQSLPDPTRPPAEFSRPVQGAAPAAAALPRVQSILIGKAPGGRRLAVIDGVTVLQGGSFRGATVTKIAPNEVELFQAGARQTLRLYPLPPARPPSAK